MPHPRPAADRRTPRRAASACGYGALVFGLLSLATLGVATQAIAAPGDPQAPRAAETDVRLLTLQLPLTSQDDERYKAAILRAVDRLEQSSGGDQRPTLVLHLSVDGRAELPDGRGNKLETAQSLARLLISNELAGVRTIAYLPKTIRGHAVLVAMACEEIAMAPEAEIGEAAVDEPEDRQIEAFVVGLYRQIAETRRTVPEAVAVGWIDRRAEVFRVESEDRIDLALRQDLPEIERQRTIVSQDLLTPAGALGLYSGRLGRELGFVKYLTPDREALARVLQAPLASLEEDQSLLAAWNPVVIDLQGPITRGQASRVETLLGSELNERGANWIGLRIDSSGGDLESCLQLAMTLAELDAAEVRTVAYVPGEASGAAALVALACDQLVMQPGATVGGGVVVVDGRGNRPPPPQQGPGPEPPPPDRRLRRNAEPAGDGGANQDGDQQDNDASDQIDSAVLSIRESLAGSSGRTASLLAATIDRRISASVYTNRQTAAQRVFTEEEAAAQPDAGDWRKGEEVTKPGETLRLEAGRAAQIGVAWRIVETFDELRGLYGFEQPPRVATPNWALELVEALAAPQLAMLLLMVAFLGVYVELNMPGTGIGGFVAAVAFMLFFWSKFTAQTADWLEVMLFLTGVVCILLELLVLPGFGVFGFGGALLVLASLVLASQTFLLPKTESQLAELRTTLTTIAGSFAGLLVIGMILRRYLPHTPMFRQMTLAHPTGADLIELENRETVADYAHLVGLTGVATTDLLPSGKAEISGELVDVIAQGAIVDRGATVEVVSARASRVMVRAIKR